MHSSNSTNAQLTASSISCKRGYFLRISVIDGCRFAIHWRLSTRVLVIRSSISTRLPALGRRSRISRSLSSLSSADSWAVSLHKIAQLFGWVKHSHIQSYCRHNQTAFTAANPQYSYTPRNFSATSHSVHLYWNLIKQLNQMAAKPDKIKHMWTTNMSSNRQSTIEQLDAKESSHKPKISYAKTETWSVRSRCFTYRRDDCRYFVVSMDADRDLLQRTNSSRWPVCDFGS